MKIDINLQTKVADLLQAYPKLGSTLMDLSPVFTKLKNPVLRRTVAKMTTIRQAATIAAISPPLLIQKLREAVGLPTSIDESNHDSDLSNDEPDWFDNNKITINFNASPIIESGESPMQKILELSSNLEKGTIMNVIAPFRPIPIIEILRSKGFSVWSRGDDNFFIKE